jgi:hypothetical protein
MRFDRAFAEAKLSRDMFVGTSAANQGSYFLLAARQHVKPPRYPNYPAYSNLERGEGTRMVKTC